jgi:hypothetical protein
MVRDVDDVPWIQVTGLHPQSPVFLHDNFQRSHRSHWSAATMRAAEYRHLHPSNCKNKLIYAHTTSRIPPTSDISSITLPAPEAGDFVESILP